MERSNQIAKQKAANERKNGFTVIVKDGQLEVYQLQAGKIGGFVWRGNPEAFEIRFITLPGKNGLCLTAFELVPRK